MNCEEKGVSLGKVFGKSFSVKVKSFYVFEFWVWVVVNKASTLKADFSDSCPNKRWAVQGYGVEVNESRILFIYFIKPFISLKKCNWQKHIYQSMSCLRFLQRHDIQHKDTQHMGLISDIQYNDNRHNNTLPLCWMLLFWVSHFIYCYAECHYAECHYAECRYAECRSGFYAGVLLANNNNNYPFQDNSKISKLKTKIINDK